MSRSISFNAASDKITARFFNTAIVAPIRVILANQRTWKLPGFEMRDS